MSAGVEWGGVLSSEHVSGRSRAIELPCCKYKCIRTNMV